MSAPEDGLSRDLSGGSSLGLPATLFQAAVEAAGEAVIITSPDLDRPGPVIQYVNPAFTRMTGYSSAEVMGQTPRLLQGPTTDRSVLDRLRADLTARGEFRGEAVNYRKDGTPYHFDWLITAIRGPDGQVLHWVAIQRDITHQKQAEEHRRIILAELQHRVRNTMAVVRAIARRTAQTSSSVEDYAMHLDGRLNAFSRVQALVTRDPTRGVDLEFLVAEELLAFAAHEGDKVSIAGPKVMLEPPVAETFGLAVHELATNAVKFGALAHDKAGLHVSWHVDGDGQAEPVLWFEWQESGVPGVFRPEQTGFGFELLERVLSYQLNARTTLHLTADGLSCTIELPLTVRPSRLQWM